MSSQQMVVFKRSFDRWIPHIKRVAQVQEVSTVLSGGDLSMTVKWRNRDNSADALVWKLRAKDVFQPGGRPQRVCRYVDDLIRRVLQNRGVL